MLIYDCGIARANSSLRSAGAPKKFAWKVKPGSVNPVVSVWPRGPVTLTLLYAPVTATPPYLSPRGNDHRRVADPRRLTARLFGKGRSEADAVSVLLFRKSS